MSSPRALATAVVLSSAVLLMGWTTFHIELNASFPDEDQALTEAPEEVWLEFSVPVDMERSSFSIRGEDGSVDLAEISAGDSPEFLRADVDGSLAAGTYTVSWVAAPLDDHAVRGRFKFSVQARD